MNTHSLYVALGGLLQFASLPPGLKSLLTFCSIFFNMLLFTYLGWCCVDFVLLASQQPFGLSLARLAVLNLKKKKRSKKIFNCFFPSLNKRFSFSFTNFVCEMVSNCCTNCPIYSFSPVAACACRIIVHTEMTGALICIPGPKGRPHWSSNICYVDKPIVRI